MNDGNSNTRILLAVVLSVLFLIPYMYFFTPKDTTKENKQIVTSTDAPTINKETNTINAPKEADDIEIIATMTSKLFDIKFDNLGRIHSVELKGKKWENEEGLPLNLIDKNSIKPLEMRYKDKNINKNAFLIPYKANIDRIDLDSKQNKLILTQDLGEVTIKKTITFFDNLKYDLQVETSKPIEYFISSGSRPMADNTEYVFKGIIVKKSDDKIEDIDDDDEKNSQTFNNAKFIAGVDRYYATLFFNDNGFNVVTQPQDGKVIPYISFDNNASISGYIGPKDYRELKNISPALTDVVEYGIITFFAKPLFLLLDFASCRFNC